MKKFFCAAAGTLLFLVLLMVSGTVAGAAQSGSLASVTEEAQMKPMEDGSGTYLLKSDGFYCLQADGTVHGAAYVHYFDHFVIDGTVFNGYYYHDESGKFRAGTSQMIYLKQVLFSEAPGETTQEDTAQAYWPEGCYMLNNLGKLSAAAQVRYMDRLTLNGKTWDGYYFFDETGKMDTEPGIHFLEMDSHGRSFEGYYYFGGEDGGLLSEEGVTAQGYTYDETGKITNLEEPAIERLETELEELVSGYSGQWSIYVKDLGREQEIVLNNRQMTSASLIKAFVMAETFSEIDNVRENQLARLGQKQDENAAVQKVDTLLKNMITVSDNESFNELVRLQVSKYDFLSGARKINRYLKAEGYTDTEVQHTLSPSSTSPVGIGENNVTSVSDCGLLLERIYEGTCVSEEASGKMLDLLLQQQNRTKIPQPLAEDLQVANKTGETDTTQHDIAIVYGEETTYILCVMSEGYDKNEYAIEHIRSISQIVYEYLNAVEIQ